MSCVTAKWFSLGWQKLGFISLGEWLDGSFGWIGGGIVDGGMRVCTFAIDDVEREICS